MKNFQIFIRLFLVIVLGLVFTRIYLRVHTTEVAYKLGYLKNKEGKVLEENTKLRTELAELSTKKNLLKIVKNKKEGKQF